MAFSIGPLGNQRNEGFQLPPTPAFNPAQTLGQPQNHNQGGQGMQGMFQDAMLSLSPEAMESLAPPRGGANPQQLEQQIQSGDLESALSTIEELDASRPAQGNDPNAELKAQLKEQLQQGDQQAAVETLQQIKAQAPPPPPGK